jgi:hypothetical protein
VDRVARGREHASVSPRWSTCRLNPGSGSGSGSGPIFRKLGQTQFQGSVDSCGAECLRHFQLLCGVVHRRGSPSPEGHLIFRSHAADIRTGERSHRCDAHEVRSSTLRQPGWGGPRVGAACAACRTAGSRYDKRSSRGGQGPCGR